MNTILIARHGNTFDSGDTVVRVGRRTDLPLSQSGLSQAESLGKFLKDRHKNISAAFTSNLKRTVETAQVALQQAKINIPIEPLSIFDEIDYGPDEAKTEKEVIHRLGAQALHDWNTLAVVPKGWDVNPELIVENWKTFADDMLEKFPNQTVLVVTSNGIARFAPYLTHDFISFSEKHDIKLSTGAVASLSYRDEKWDVDYWNEKPA